MPNIEENCAHFLLNATALHSIPTCLSQDTIFPLTLPSLA